MKKYIITLALGLLVLTSYGQIARDMDTKMGRFIEWRGKMHRAGITMGNDQSITITGEKFHIVNKRETNNSKSHYLELQCMSPGSVKYTIVLDLKHKNLFISKGWSWI